MDCSEIPATETAEAAPEFSAHGKRLGVFVISYNAEKLIKNTLDRIPESIWREVEVVYVVDDCSTDETTHEVVQYPQHTDKIKIFRNRSNRRYGGNQKFGYQYAIDRGLDAVVMLHGDGQYAPELLPDMFRPLVEDQADVVIGSRMINRRDAIRGGMPKYKFIANIFLTWFENVLSGLSLSEFHSGYRGYSTAYLSRIPLWENSDEWHFDSHILFQAKSAKAKIVEFAIPTKYGDEVCHVNGITYGLNCLAGAILYRMHRCGLINLAKYDMGAGHLEDMQKFVDPYSSHTLINKRLQKMKLQDTRILDLGFGCSAIASALSGHAAIIDGIDRSPRAVAEFGHIFETVYPNDLNNLDTIPLENQYDIILAADVLQFLIDPALVLSKLKRHLKKGGALIVALPNFVNINTRLKILFGQFTLRRRGIIESDALHFYTLASARQLLSRTGWVVEETDVTCMPIPIVFPFTRRRFWRPLIWTVRGATLLFKNLFGYQGIFFCKNPNESELL